MNLYLLDKDNLINDLYGYLKKLKELASILPASS